MRERPIIFNAEMVRAILDGRKVQTRRPVNPQPYLSENAGFCQSGRCYGSGFTEAETIKNFLHRCHIGAQSDRLWVREVWAEICKSADPYCHCAEEGGDPDHYFEYRADTGNRFPGQWDDADKEEQLADYVPRWRSPMHMPRRASRILLEITNVRLEKVRSISADDCVAEGLKRDWCESEFRKLWNSIYLCTPFSWAHNPWVWVIEFKRIVE